MITLASSPYLIECNEHNLFASDERPWSTSSFVHRATGSWSGVWWMGMEKPCSCSFSAK